MYVKVIIIILFSSFLFAQQNQIKDLSIGNKWFYKQTGWAQGGINLNASRKVEVVGDTLIDGIEYAKLSENYIGENGYTHIYRFFEMADSSKLSTVYLCNFAGGPDWVNELSYNFLMEAGEIFYNDPSGSYQPWFEIEYKGDTTLFNQQLNYIKINTWDCRYFSGNFDHMIIIERFGMIHRNSDDIDEHVTQVLQGALIDGVVYGDTLVVVSVEDDNINYPDEYSLLQNYPNPFNPTTTIKYEIPESKFVILAVYDILGREVAILVNEEKPAGSYEVVFTSSDLISGVYFYQLRAGNYIETKKMIILR